MTKQPTTSFNAGNAVGSIALATVRKTSSAGHTVAGTAKSTAKTVGNAISSFFAGVKAGYTQQPVVQPQPRKRAARSTKK